MNNKNRTTWATWLGYLSVVLRMWIGWLVVFLLGTLWGVFLLSLLAYFSAEPIFGLRVFSVSELIVWFAEQSEGAQVAVAAGVLTALGLVSAYWTAISAFKTQKDIEIRMETGRKVQQVFQDVHRFTRDIGSYLYVLQLNTQEVGKLPPNEQAFHLYWCNSKADTYGDLVQGLHESRMEISALFSTDGAVLANTPGLFNKLRAAHEIVDAAWELCIAFYRPKADPQSPSFVADFLKQYDDARATAAMKACDRVTAEVSPVVGFIAGRLLAPALRPRLSGILLVTSSPKFFASTFARVWRAKPSGKLPNVDQP
jgi:hypothetical protein